MRFATPLLLLPALTSAFLIPPHFTDEELQELSMPIDLGAGLAMAQATMSRIVRIPCDDCPFPDAGVETDLVSSLYCPARGPC